MEKQMAPAPGSSSAYDFLSYFCLLMVVVIDARIYYIEVELRHLENRKNHGSDRTETYVGEHRWDKERTGTETHLKLVEGYIVLLD